MRLKNNKQIEELFLQNKKIDLKAQEHNFFVTMFNLYLKKEQYGRVSSMFKNHFEKRDQKVNFVISKDNRIQEKMKAFNQLICDDFQDEKKLSPLNSSGSNDKRMPKIKSIEQMSYNPLNKLTGEIQKWTNLKSNKSLHKENITGWMNFQKEKEKREIFQGRNTSQILRKDPKFQESKAQNKKLRFLIDIKSKIETTPVSENSSNHKSCQDKQSQCQNESTKDEKKKGRFMRHKKHLSQVLNLKGKYNGNNTTNRKALKKSAMNKTFCGLENYKQSITKEEFGKNQCEDENDFKDDNIHEKMRQSVGNKSIEENDRNSDFNQRNFITKSHELMMNASRTLKMQLPIRNLTGFQINPSKKLNPLTEKKKPNTIIVQNTRFL